MNIQTQSAYRRLISEAVDNSTTAKRRTEQVVFRPMEVNRFNNGRSARSLAALYNIRSL